MAISVVGQASAAATSVAFPAHAAGDMLLVFARGTAAAPSVPAAGGTVPAWTTLQTGLANSIGLTVVSFVATGSTTTTGAFTNATHICVLVLRPGAGATIQTSAAQSSVGNGNNTQTIIYPALTLVRTDGTSVGVRVGTRTVAITAVGTAPTSWTAQSIQPAGASALMSTHTRLALAANPVADTVTTTSSNAAYRAVTVEVREIPAAQNVSPTGKATSQAFGTVGTAKGPVSVQTTGVPPPGFVGTITGQFLVGDGHRVGGSVAAQFGAPTAQVTVGTNVSVGGKGSSQAFGAVTPKATFTRTVTSVFTAQSFGLLAFRVTLGSGGVLSAGAFGTVTPKTTISRAVSGLGSPQTFGTITPRTAITRSVTGLGSAQQFGGISGSGVTAVAVTGLTSAQSFGTPTIRTAVTRAVTGVGSAQGFGSPLIARGPVTRPAGGVGSAQQFGVVSFAAIPSQTVTVPGVTRPTATVTILNTFLVGDGHLVGGSSSGLFGRPVVGGTGFTTLIPTGLASAQRFGTVTPLIFVFVPGVPSARSVGTVTVKASIGAPGGGIPSAQSFGVPYVYNRGITQVVQVPGLQQQHGVLTILNRFLVGDGTRVGETGGLFGIPDVFSDQVQVVAGLGSAQKFGKATPVNIVVIAGIASAGRFGSPKILAGFTATGVGSAQQFGVPWIAFDQFQDVLGIGSAQAFGDPFAYRVWVYPPGPPVDALLPPVVCDSVTLAPVACASETLDPVVWAEETLAASAEEDLVLTPSVEE